MARKHALSGPEIKEFLKGPIGTTTTWVCKDRSAARKFQVCLHARLQNTDRAVRTRTIPAGKGYKLIATLIDKRNHTIPPETQEGPTNVPETREGPTSAPETRENSFSRVCPWVAGVLAMALLLELLRVAL